MPLAEMVKLSFDALRQRRTRSLLTILMVVVGAALIIALSALSSGFTVLIDQQFSLLSPNTLIVSPTDLTGSGLRPTTVLDDRVVKNLANIPGVDTVFPMIQGSVTLKTGSTSKRVTIMGLNQEKTSLIVPNFELAEGSLVSSYDTVGILLGDQVKYPTGSTAPIATLGQSVTIEYTHSVSEGGVQKAVVERKNFVVRGSVVNLGSGFMIPLDSSISTSLKAADSLFDKGGKYDTIIIVTKSSSLNQQVEDGIRKIYGQNIGVTSTKVLVQSIQTIISGLTVFILAIGAVSLMVAAVGIVTTLITSVMERTREIGLFKAIGFRNRQILLLFLLEAMIIGLIGASVGLVGGFLLGNFIPTILTSAMSNIPDFGGTSGAGDGMMGGQMFSITPVFLLSSLVSVWIFSVVLSSVAGIYPAWRASRLNPVDALRKEL